MNRQPGALVGTAGLLAAWLALCGFEAFGPPDEFFRRIGAGAGIQIAQLGDAIPAPKTRFPGWAPTSRDYDVLATRVPSAPEVVRLLAVLAREASRRDTLPCRYCAGCPDHERVGVLGVDADPRREIVLDLGIGEAIATEDGRLVGRFSIAGDESLLRAITLESAGWGAIRERPERRFEDLTAEQLSMAFAATAPTAVTKVPPEYPTMARESNVDGTVIVDALVDASGQVVDVRVVKSIPLLDAAAVTCTRRWQFRPALDCERHGVETWVRIPLKFSLH